MSDVIVSQKGSNGDGKLYCVKSVTFETANKRGEHGKKNIFVNVSVRYKGTKRLKMFVKMSVGV